MSKEPEGSEIFDFGRLHLAVRRHYKRLAYVVGFCVVLASLYILITPSMYTAEAVVLLDREQANVAAEISASAQKGFEAALIESQVEIIKSRNLALSVLDEVKSEEYIEALRANDVEAQEEIINSQIENLKVRQVGETYVLAIRYSALDPATAAKITNAYAAAYILDQISAGQQASAKGAGWLQARIAELREKAREASQKVNEFRKENNLYDTNGRSINESQLAELNSRLGEARGDTASAQAKYEYSQNVIKQRDVDAATAEALDNDVINNVRTEYLSSKKRLSELTRILGPDHTVVKNLARDIQDYEALIFGEMERITQSQLSAYKVAAAREKTLESSLSQLIGVKAENDSLLSELQGLERESSTYEALYESYMEKFEGLSQKESFPISGSRIITPAVPPLEKSHPKALLILGVAVILGTGIGLLLIIHLDFTDKTIRTGKQVQDELGISFMGYFPLVPFKERRKNIRAMSRAAFRFFDLPKIEAINNPLSVNAETLRKARALVDRKRGTEVGCVIGVISCIPNEGKTTVAINLALSLAKTGAPCLLVDADVRNPTIVQAHLEEELYGLGDVLAGDVELDDALIKEERTGLSILASHGKSTELVLEKVNPAVMRELLSGCARKYQYIVLDLPPLAASSDTLCFSSSIDQYLIVAEWAATRWDDIAFAIRENEIESGKILGAVLNKADMQQLTKFYGFKVYPEYMRSTAQQS